MRTGARGWQTESGWEKWVRSSDECVFDERGRGRRKDIVYIGLGQFSSTKHLYAGQNREGLRMKVRLLVEGYISLK